MADTTVAGKEEAGGADKKSEVKNTDGQEQRGGGAGGMTAEKELQTKPSVDPRSDDATETRHDQHANSQSRNRRTACCEVDCDGSGR